MATSRKMHGVSLRSIDLAELGILVYLTDIILFQKIKIW